MVDDPQIDIKSLRKIVKDNPDDSEAWRFLGIALMDKAKWTEAIYALEKAAQSPDNFVSLVALAHAYVETMRYNEAETVLRKVLSTEYDNAVVLQNLAYVLYFQDRYQEAEDALRLSLQYDELDAWTHCFLADILAERGRGAESLPFYIRATMLDDQDFDAWVGIGNHFILRREYHAAEQPFKKAVQLRPDDTSCLVSLGISQYELKKYKKAVQTLRRVLVNHPTNAKALVVLGKTLYMLEKTEAAEKIFSKAKRAWKKLDSFHASRAWTDLGSFYIEIDSYNRARKALSKACALYPTLEEPHNILESLYHKMNRDQDAHKERMIIEQFRSEIEFIPDIPYDDIDFSIHEVIRRFNALGLKTTESCSGIKEDHIGRKSEHNPFLYIEVNHPSLPHHLITIGDMAGWISEYSGTCFHFSLKDCSQEEIGKRWNLLLSSAEAVMKSIANASNLERGV